MENSLNTRHLLLARKATEEVYVATVFHDTIKNSKWFLEQSLSLSGFAVGYPFALCLYRVLNDFKPQNLFEIGLGQSTLITSQYASFYGADLTVIEQSKEWTDVFVNMHKELLQKVNVVNLDIKKRYLPDNYKTQRAITNCPIPPFKIVDSKEFIKEKEDLYYMAFDGLDETLKKYNKNWKNKIDFAIIDGPFDENRKDKTFARRDLLSLSKYLADDFMILLDDTDRFGEQQTLIDFMMCQYPQRKFYFANLWGYKCSTLICTEKYKYAATSVLLQ